MFGWGSRIVIILVIGGCVAENYRGHYVWKKYRQELEAKGERFELAALAPKPVPPDQNFAATPFFAPFLEYVIDETDREHPYRWKDKQRYEYNRSLVGFPSDSKQKKASETGQWQLGTFTDFRLWQDYFGGNTNFPSEATAKDPASQVLAALRKYDGVLDELLGASVRPSCVFAIHYDEHYQALLPHLAALKEISQIVRLRALAHVEADHPIEALRDIVFGFRLTETLKSERLLISSLVRIRLAESVLQPVWEGLARRRWSEPQVAELQAALARINILEDYGPTMRMERSVSIHFVEQLRTGQYRHLAPSTDGGEETAKDYKALQRLPGGVFRQNQFTIAWRYQERLLPLVDAEEHRVDVRGVNRAGAVRESTRFHPYALFANLLVPPLSRVAERFARAQAGVDLALVACALERHRLAHGRYPDTLEALVPKFLPAIPPDVITGEPLKYRLTEEGHFLLYSVGWNQVDEGGTPGLTPRAKNFDPGKGDWVWRCSAVVTPAGRE